MRRFEDLRDFVHLSEPLAPLTWLRLGGPAEYLARPKNLEQLRAVVLRCQELGVPFRVLSAGTNVLVSDAGVGGMVIHLESPAFSDVRIQGRQVESGAAVPVTALISQTARHGLAGLELLTGIPGTVGGALRGNAGSREAAFGQFVESVQVLDASAEVVTRVRDELNFDSHGSNLDDPVILGCTLVLEPEDPETVVRRMRKVWILKKENQPYGHQPSCLVFKDPSPEVSARLLIDQCGLKGTRSGLAEVSDRHSAYVVAYPGATSADVVNLIELVRLRVQEATGYVLEPQIEIW